MTDLLQGSAFADVPVVPRVEFPVDPALPDLAKLFDGNWVWQASRSQFADADRIPCQFRVRQFSHTPGRSATISYFADWAPEEFQSPDILSCRIEAGTPPAFSRYPRDQFLPGLEQAAYPDSALSLLNEHVFAFPRRKLRVNMIRYRPGNRAVLRHRSGKIGLYVRLMRPSRVEGLLKAAEIIGHSGFAVPRTVGYWRQGGAVWLSEIPGRNVRRLMRRAKPPDPDAILDGLESLWSASRHAEGRAFDLRGAYRRAKRTFRHALGKYDDVRQVCENVSSTLDPFVRTWQPSTIAHNDLYDDQMLLLPDGRVAIVDFEEAGPGDPMLDIGNFLAHLKWAAHDSSSAKKDVSAPYYHRLRDAALDRLKWNQSDLDMREAVCLFRITTNAIRRPDQNWRHRTLKGLSLVANTLN